MSIRSRQSISFRLKILVGLLALGIAFAVLPGPGASGQGTATVTVVGANGSAGGTVDIPVTITNRSGAAGVQFKLYYNSAVVEPGTIRAGNIFQSPPFVQANTGSDGQGAYINVAVISTHAFSSDGTIITIPFTLKSAGQTSPLTLSGLVVSGEDGFPIPCNPVNGSITVNKTPLAKAGKPWWDGDVIRWNAVSNAASYRVVLYRDGSQNWSGEVSGTSRDFATRMSEQGPGSYTVTVQALAGGSGTYSDGPVSDSSAANVKAKPSLAQAGKPAWDGDTAAWTGVENTHRYRVRLYRNGSLDHTVEVSGLAYNFNTRIVARGPGRYTVTVQALAAAGGNYSDGPASVHSDPNIKTATLARVNKPAWSGDTITWSGVAHAVNYEVKLYRGAQTAATRTVAANLLSYDWQAVLNQLGAGAYTATVRALGDGTIVFHGQESLHSAENDFQPKPDQKEQPASGGSNNGDTEGNDKQPGSDSTPAAPGKPAWSAGGPGEGMVSTITFGEVEGPVSAYWVILYRGPDEVTAKTVSPAEGMSGSFQLDFADYLVAPGFYYVVVQVLSGTEESGDDAYRSEILVITGETEAGSGVYRAEGTLPFAGLWMHFTAEAAVNGVMMLARYTDSDLAPPAELDPAGVFVEVTLGPELAGTVVRIEIDYDPALLPGEMDESSLRLYRCDPETGEWEQLESGVNLAARRVWAEVEQFSVIGLFGGPAAPPAGAPANRGLLLLGAVSQYSHLLLPGALVAGLLTGGILVFRRRRVGRRRKRGLP